MLAFVVFIGLSLALVSQVPIHHGRLKENGIAIVLNDNMLMYMMMMNPAFSQGLFGGGQEGAQSGMPLFLMASGNDNMKRLGQGFLLSRMLMGGGNGGAAPAQG